ncbi:hypothetical protein [Aeromonas veronii]|uniref:hypothetical protein n=1 Tax=Aeromonas veronii TaxID=654 RepID=UPI000DCFFC3E|nr:hypothetical protein [Aeromonas veronii]
MNKKDRIASVISLFGLVLMILFVFGGAAPLAVISFLIIAAYWGYRFIKGDISFIGDKYKS